MRLLLVRHGETESNRQGLALGRADLPLNENGRRQAGCLAKTLASEPLAAVYSSPLTRAADTATAIALEHGLKVQTETELIEMDIGEAEGLTFIEVRERFPELAQNWGGPDGPTFRMPGGECLVDVQVRASDAINLIVQRHLNETICVVTHNFVILSFLVAAVGVDLADFRRLRHAVAAITELDITAERTRIVRLNDTCHVDRES